MTKGTLYYTKYSENDRVKSIDYYYDGAGHLQIDMDSKKTICTENDGMEGADGIAPHPDGGLIVAAQKSMVYKISKTAKMNNDRCVVTYSRTSAGVWHLVVDPNRKYVWAAGIPAHLHRILITDSVQNHLDSRGYQVKLQKTSGDRVFHDSLATLIWDKEGQAFFTYSNYYGGGCERYFDSDTTSVNYDFRDCETDEKKKEAAKAYFGYITDTTKVYAKDRLAADTLHVAVGDTAITKMKVKILIDSLEGAHGGTYDPYSNTIFVFGGARIVQIKPQKKNGKMTASIVGIIDMHDYFFNDSYANLTEPRTNDHVGWRLDNGMVDGHGHLFVTSNTGHLVFVDYTSNSQKYITDNVLVHVQWIDDYLVGLVHEGESLPDDALEKGDALVSKAVIVSPEPSSSASTIPVNGKDYLLTDAKGFPMDLRHGYGLDSASVGSVIAITLDPDKVVEYFGSVDSLRLVSTPGIKLVNPENGEEKDSLMVYAKESITLFVTANQIAHGEYIEVHRGNNLAIINDINFCDCYTIRFFNSTEIVHLSLLKSGSTPVYEGELPTRVDNQKWTYSFKAWNPAITEVTGDASYEATFDSALQKYAVAFMNGDSTLKTFSLDYGESPKYEGDLPSRDANQQWTYSFKGWNPAIAEVTDNATYEAAFDSVLQKYTVLFMNGDNKLKTLSLDYGESPKYEGDLPSRDANQQWSYSFKGWSPAISEVTGDITYKAAFDSSLQEYSVVFMNGDDKLQTVMVKYGDTPEYTGDTPTKNLSDRITCEFTDWWPKLAPITKEAKFHADFACANITGIQNIHSANSGVSIRVLSRSIQVTAAPVGTSYALIDMQGRLLQKGRVESETFDITVPRAGTYLVQVGGQVRNITVRGSRQ